MRIREVRLTGRVPSKGICRVFGRAKRWAHGNGCAQAKRARLQDGADLAIPEELLKRVYTVYQQLGDAGTKWLDVPPPMEEVRFAMFCKSLKGVSAERIGRALSTLKRWAKWRDAKKPELQAKGMGQRS